MECDKAKVRIKNLVVTWDELEFEVDTITRVKRYQKMNVNKKKS